MRWKCAYSWTPLVLCTIVIMSGWCVTQPEENAIGAESTSGTLDLDKMFDGEKLSTTTLSTVECHCLPACLPLSNGISCPWNRTVSRVDCPCCSHKVCAREAGQSCNHDVLVCDRQLGLECDNDTNTCSGPFNLLVMEVSHNSSTLRWRSWDYDTENVTVSISDDLSGNGTNWKDANVTIGDGMISVKHLTPGTVLYLRMTDVTNASEIVIIETKAGCLQNDTSYGVGESFTVECDQRCICEAGGNAACTPRCITPTTSPFDDNRTCRRVFDPTDPCCTTLSCEQRDGHSLLAREPQIIVTKRTPDSLTVAWDDFKVPGPTFEHGYVIEYRPTVYDPTQVLPWTRIPVKHAPFATIPNLKPNTAYEVRVFIWEDVELKKYGPSTDITTLTTEDGCVWDGHSTKVGKTFEKGCEARCLCLGNDTTECGERCVGLYQLKGSIASDDPNCREEAIPDDPCCIAVICTGSKTTPPASALSEPDATIWLTLDKECPQQISNVDETCPTTCHSSQDCKEENKCCLTECGGTICVAPKLVPLMHKVAETTPTDNPCLLTKCGPNAICGRFKQTAHCHCLPGFSGNPYNSVTGCLPAIQTQMPTKTKAGCVFKNATYLVGETFYDKCKLKCECTIASGTYEVDCQPRCGKEKLDVFHSGCHQEPDPDDECCKIMVCATPTENKAIHEIHKNATEQETGCEYKGRHYRKDEHFYEGCENSCHCLGFQEVACNTRCPLIPKVKPGCVVVRHPSDEECCKVVICNLDNLNFTRMQTVDDDKEDTLNVSIRVNATEMADAAGNTTLLESANGLAVSDNFTMKVALEKTTVFSDNVTGMTDGSNGTQSENSTLLGNETTTEESAHLFAGATDKLILNGRNSTEVLNLTVDTLEMVNTTEILFDFINATNYEVPDVENSTMEMLQVTNSTSDMQKVTNSTDDLPEDTKSTSNKSEATNSTKDMPKITHSINDMMKDTYSMDDMPEVTNSTSDMSGIANLAISGSLSSSDYNSTENVTLAAFIAGAANNSTTMHNNSITIGNMTTFSGIDNDKLVMNVTLGHNSDGEHLFNASELEEILGDGWQANIATETSANYTLSSSVQEMENATVLMDDSVTENVSPSLHDDTGNAILNSANDSITESNITTSVDETVNSTAAVVNREVSVLLNDTEDDDIVDDGNATIPASGVETSESSSDGNAMDRQGGMRRVQEDNAAAPMAIEFPKHNGKLAAIHKILPINPTTVRLQILLAPSIMEKMFMDSEAIAVLFTNNLTHLDLIDWHRHPLALQSSVVFVTVDRSDVAVETNIVDLLPNNQYYFVVVMQKEVEDPDLGMEFEQLSDIEATVTIDLGEGMCEFMGKTFKISDRLYDECQAVCDCLPGRIVHCEAIICPNQISTERSGCLEWDVDTTNIPRAPLCCPEATCRYGSTCKFKGKKFSNLERIPAGLLDECDQQCKCLAGNINCKPRCHPVPSEPPKDMGCEPILSLLPGDKCCKHWHCEMEAENSTIPVLDEVSLFPSNVTEAENITSSSSIDILMNDEPNRTNDADTDLLAQLECTYDNKTYKLNEQWRVGKGHRQKLCSCLLLPNGTAFVECQGGCPPILKQHMDLIPDCPPENVVIWDVPDLCPYVVCNKTDIGRGVKNVTVETLNATSIRVTFVIPNIYVGLYGHIEILYTMDLTHSDDTTTWNKEVFSGPSNQFENARLSHEMGGLQPDTEYYLKVVAVIKNTKNMDSSDIVTIRMLPLPTTTTTTTTTTLPPKISIDARLSANNSQATSVDVKWRSFEESERRFIDGVYLQYKLHSDESQQWSKTMMLHRDVNEFTLEYLKPNSEYDVEIVIIPPPNVSTEIMSGLPVPFRTKQLSDDFEFNLTLTIDKVTADTVDLIWTGVPYPELKYINVYKFLYRMPTNNKKEAEPTFLYTPPKGNQFQFTVDRLMPETNYSVWMEAILRNGKVRQSNTINIATKQGPMFMKTSEKEKLEASLETNTKTYGNAYYAALIVVAVIAALCALGFIILLVILLRKQSSAKAPITSCKSHSAYDNPTYKESLD